MLMGSSTGEGKKSKVSDGIGVLDDVEVGVVVGTAVIEAVGDEVGTGVIEAVGEKVEFAVGFAVVEAVGDIVALVETDGGE